MGGLAGRAAAHVLRGPRRGDRPGRGLPGDVPVLLLGLRPGGRAGAAGAGRSTGLIGAPGDEPAVAQEASQACRIEEVEPLGILTTGGQRVLGLAGVPHALHRRPGCTLTSQCSQARNNGPPV